MNALMQEHQTWQHFIGGYYSDTNLFITEAKRSGISRRAPAQAVRGMQFGDRLILLRYRKAMSFAFAEAQIVGMTLDHNIADAVGQQLKDKGLATYEEAGSGAGMTIQRECGSYFLCGTWTVRCSWEKVISIALEIASQRGEPLFIMVNARLIEAYSDPVYLSPSPKFSRGFTRIANDTTYTPWHAKPADGSVLSITAYQKAAHRHTPLLEASA